MMECYHREASWDGTKASWGELGWDKSTAMRIAEVELYDAEQQEGNDTGKFSAPTAALKYHNWQRGG